MFGDFILNDISKRFDKLKKFSLFSEALKHLALISRGLLHDTTIRTDFEVKCISALTNEGVWSTPFPRDFYVLPNEYYTN
jgi:hypothetical protein